MLYDQVTVEVLNQMMEFEHVGPIDIKRVYNLYPRRSAEECFHTLASVRQPNGFNVEWNKFCTHICVQGFGAQVMLKLDHSLSFEDNMATIVGDMLARFGDLKTQTLIKYCFMMEDLTEVKKYIKLAKERSRG